MKKITVKFSTIDELRKKYPQVHVLTDWEILPSAHRDKSALVLHSETYGAEPRVFYSDRHHLVEMAKTILQQFDPSPEQEILETLKRIEARLQETSLR